jgi:amino acid transporter
MGSHLLAKVHPRLRTPPFAVFVVFAVPSLINLLPSTTIARVIAFAVIGNYIAFAFVVVAALIARRRGWQPAGHFRLGRFGWPVTIGALVYQLAVIVILSDKTPPFGSSFFDRWFVPISAAFVAVVGVVYYIVVRPQRRAVHDEAGTPQESPIG